MKPDLIYELLDLVISLVQTQFDSGNAERILFDLIEKSIRAYEEERGEPLNPWFRRREVAI